MVIFCLKFNCLNALRNRVPVSHKKEKVQEKYFYLEK